jgi:hypothetical protein
VAAPRKSIFRTIAEAVNTELVTILRAEGRAVPSGNVAGEPDDAGGFIYGKTPQVEHSQYPRIQWVCPRGTYSFVEESHGGATRDDPASTDPKPPPLLVLRKNIAIWIWSASDEWVEHVELTLPIATARSAYDRFFHWSQGHEERPDQELGVQVKNGTYLSRIHVLLDLQVSSEYEGETTLREVERTKLRAAIAASLADDPEDEIEWQPEEFTPD